MKRLFYISMQDGRVCMQRETNSKMTHERWYDCTRSSHKRLMSAIHDITYFEKWSVLIHGSDWEFVNGISLFRME